MKKFLIAAMLLLVSEGLCAQEDVTKFLGIPVDGPKSKMIRSLKSKGFRSTDMNNVLKGQFNGYKVDMHVVTNNNKVWRLMVADAYGVDESDIKIRFNNLCQQFANNPNYISFVEDQTIPDDEDVSYEMAAHKKRYEAVFCQKISATDSLVALYDLKRFVTTKYSRAWEDIFPEQWEEVKSAPDFIQYAKERFDQLYNKIVWFMIFEESDNKYKINMYYDNAYNRAQGEDL